MNKKWRLWRWLAIASILFGILLAMFQPTLNDTADPGDYLWSAIGLRLFGFIPLCFFAFAVLVLFFRFMRPVFRWLFNRRTLKWFLRALAALVILLALLYLEENWRGKHAWENCKNELEAKGEKLDFASFVPPPVPDDQNFALTPIVASGYSRIMDKKGQRFQPENTNIVNRLKMDIYRPGLLTSSNLLLGSWQICRLTDLNAWQTYYRATATTNVTGMPGMPIGSGKIRQTVTNDSGLVTTTEIQFLTTNEFPITPQPQSPAADVLFALGKYDLAIEELRTASQLPFSRFPLNYTTNKPTELIFPHCQSLKFCALALRLRAVAELENGQSDKALADVRLMLHLANSIRREPSEYSFDVQMSLVNFAIQPVWEGLARRQWSADQLAALEQDLAGMDAVKDYGFALRAALTFTLKTLEYLRTERRANSFTDWNGDTLWLPTLIYRLSPSGWFFLNEWATAHVYEAALPTATEQEQHIFAPAISERFWQAEGLERRRHLKIESDWLAFVPPLPRKAMNAARIQAGVDMARVACALERYRLAHGQYPETLDALVPQFIAMLPHDIINGQPLHYRRPDNGQFVLYSVGWNGKDDGGVPEDPRQFFQSTPSGDWVWQYPQK